MLNPAIYSAHLKLHPLMVLITLVVAEHNMGVWGLLLAVPMTVFALDYLIRYPQSTVTEVGAKELEKVGCAGVGLCGRVCVHRGWLEACKQLACVQAACILQLCDGQAAGMVGS
jgi:hypothetical protein